LPDDRYQALVNDAKDNTAHAENVYVAFSGMLEQHHGFDWLTRCFVAKLDPVRGFQKTNKFIAAAVGSTPPLVIQGEDKAATVLYRTKCGHFQRIVCGSPAHALSAWLMMVEEHNDGMYSRKARSCDIIQQFMRTLAKDTSSIPIDIGGAVMDIVNAPQT
jgi:hypothetical protein